LEILEHRSLPSSGDVPMAVTLHLAPASAPAGDHVAVTAPRLALTGRTAPGATVVLSHEAGSGRLHALARTKADARGDYHFTIPCPMGTTALTVRATDADGDRAAADLDVTRANQSFAWNSVALQAIRTARAQAPDAARDLAIVAVSVYDAVDSIDPRSAPYAVAVRAPGGASPEAAAAAAAHAALVGLFPGQAALLDAQLAAALRAPPGGAAARWAGTSWRTSCCRWGRARSEGAAPLRGVPCGIGGRSTIGSR
ncbi:MAG: hypothetical protein QOE66_3090, partial [Chloroflexota bacterium]|nr:hypothetical protein [Chloroflexota bacterium]